MRVYFHDGLGENDKNSQQIIKYLRQVGATLVNEPALKNKAADFESSIEKVDALILCARSLDAQGGYWLAWAIAKNKEILCLLPKGTKVDQALERLQQDQRAAKKLHVDFFQDQDLLDKLANFLEKFGQEDLNVLHNIKYTLRLSRKINEYLDWKSASTQIDKATWLRENIQDLMEADKDWQHHLSTKFKVKK